MRVHRQQFGSLIVGSSFFVLALSVAGCSGFTIAPSHVAKYTFQGKVTDPKGKPVPNARVKVRGWETLTDAQGRWKQDQVVNCGALKDHSGGFEENDAILVDAPGFEPLEESFKVKHPAWFLGCGRDEAAVVFETVLQPLTEEKQEYQRKESPELRESPAIPWPRKPTRGRGTTT